MHASITRILAELREDHRNIAQLLSLVETELKAVEHGETPDLELLHDVMQYMIIYSDAIHHPREDLVYQELHERDETLASGLEKVEADHRDIAELSLALRNDIEAMTSGVEIRRDRVLADMGEYVDKLRQHMEWEERDLFARADALGVKEDVDIDLARLSLVDPVFGEISHSLFDNLRRHLERSANR